MKKTNEQLTSVKVDIETFEQFKLECIKRKYTLNKLVNAAMKMYLNDEDFRKKLY